MLFRSLFYGRLAHAHFAVGRCEEAIEWADWALQAQPRMTAVVGIRAAACAQLGRVEEAREYLRRLCALLRPGWLTIAGIRQGWSKFVSPEFLAAGIDGLRKAGLPEE